MRLLLITENWKPQIGGIQNYLESLVGGLRERGENVEIIDPASRRFYWPFVRPAWLFLYLQIFIHALFTRHAVTLCGKALFEGLVGYYLKKQLGIPYVVFTYAMEIETWTRDDAVQKKLERVLQNADAVVYINDVTKRRLLELGVEGERLHKILPTISPNHLTRSRSHEPTQYSDRYILTIARLIKRKGVDDLIKAFARIDHEVRLIVAGDGPERENLESLAKQLGLEGRVFFEGEVTEERKQELLAGADIFAMTPKIVEGDIEGFGIVYLEAGVYDLPVIGTKTGGVVGAVLDGETGLLVEPGDVNAITEALQGLLLDKEKAHRLGRAGKERVERAFTPEVQVTKLIALLRTVR